MPDIHRAGEREEDAAPQGPRDDGPGDGRHCRSDERVSWRSSHRRAFMKFRTLAIVVIAAVSFLLLSGSAMPEQVASHFAGDGSANGVMPRSAYLGLIVGLTAS